LLRTHTLSPRVDLEERAGANQAPARAADYLIMISRELIICIGLVVAAWGHLLMHDLLGVATAWVRIDARFPPAWRSAPEFAGACLLSLGALCVLVPALG
jgi:hypothetical protein